jgi:outer membrane protein
VGGQVALNYLKSSGTKTTAFGIGPFARYYFTNSNVKPLLQVSVGYQTQKVTVGSISGTNDYASFFLGGGVAVFINENVSLEPIMGYTNNDGTGGFNFGLGFQVYLSKRQVEKVRGK